MGGLVPSCILYILPQKSGLSLPYYNQLPTEKKILVRSVTHVLVALAAEIPDEPQYGEISTSPKQLTIHLTLNKKQGSKSVFVESLH